MCVCNRILTDDWEDGCAEVMKNRLKTKIGRPPQRLSLDESPPSSHSGTRLFFFPSFSRDFANSPTRSSLLPISPCSSLPPPVSPVPVFFLLPLSLSLSFSLPFCLSHFLLQTMLSIFPSFCASVCLLIPPSLSFNLSLLNTIFLKKMF